MTDKLAERERSKYRTIWEHDVYRKVSPGEMEMQRAWDGMACREGYSLIDYGAGTGRATKWFQEQGMGVLAVDIATNALDTDVPFQETCLWDMYAVPASDYAFCCDVMEHIPEERVLDVLRGIAERTRIAAWFRIATRPDVMGPKLINTPLHLTVRNVAWWGDQLEEVFDVVQIIRSDGRDAVFLCMFDGTT